MKWTHQYTNKHTIFERDTQWEKTLQHIKIIRHIHTHTLEYTFLMSWYWYVLIWTHTYWNVDYSSLPFHIVFDWFSGSTVRFVLKLERLFPYHEFLDNATFSFSVWIFLAFISSSVHSNSFWSCFLFLFLALSRFYKLNKNGYENERTYANIMQMR